MIDNYFMRADNLPVHRMYNEVNPIGQLRQVDGAFGGIQAGIFQQNSEALNPRIGNFAYILHRNGVFRTGFGKPCSGAAKLLLLCTVIFLSVSLKAVSIHGGQCDDLPFFSIFSRNDI